MAQNGNLAIFNMSKYSHRFLINGRAVGNDEPAYIIAEAGVAHFGDMDKARALIDMAVNAKADAVKFQIFQTEEMISSSAPEWRTRMASKELTANNFAELKKYADKKDITFLATAHDLPSLQIIRNLKLPAIKIGSGELQNWEFMRKAGELSVPVILSTGLYNLDQIGEALTHINNQDTAVLHCVTAYPTPNNQVNLHAIETIRSKFQIITGYSDHTEGIHIPLAAIARGANILEKHISLDFNIEGAQDWKVSCDETSLKLLVSSIRDIESSLGSGLKIPQEVESANMLWARKSLVARNAIKSGTIIKEEMLCAKRPGTGIAPSDLQKALGKKTSKDIAADEVVTWEMLT